MVCHWPDLPRGGAVVTPRTLLSINPFDLVYKRLIATESESVLGSIDHPSACIESFDWLESQSIRHRMRRQAWFCSWRSWGMVTIIAGISSVVSFVFLQHLVDLLQMTVDFYQSPEIPPMTMAVPLILAMMAVIALLVGGLALFWDRFPGQRSTLAAIDWATACDAMAHLLSTGCTYGDSLAMAQSVMPSRKGALNFQPANRTKAWLAAAKNRVDQGREIFEVKTSRNTDETMLCLLVDADSVSETPSKSWRMAAEHFDGMAHQRLHLLTQSLPPIATVISGILLWISISSTLGGMWRAMASMLRGCMMIGGGL